MSLLVWLPLNGSLNNQGLSDITVNGTPAYGSGKISKDALDLINSRQITINCPSLNTVSKFSICFWVIGTKDVNDPDWASPIKFSANKSGSTVNEAFRFGKDNRASSNGFPIGMFNNSSYPIAATNSLTFTSASDWDKWTHICMTTDGINLKSYVNGVLITNATDGTNGFLTGTIKLRAERYNGFLNDFRVYDHCLSQKEVKELSKGLMLHYKLGGPGGENILPNSNGLVPTKYRVSNYATTKNVTVDEFGCSNAVRCTGSDGTNGIVALIGLGPSESDVYYSYSIYMKNNHLTNKIRFSSNNGGVYSEYLNPGEAKRLIAENAIGNGSSMIQFNIRTENVGDAFDFTAWHPKIEIGSKVTPWCPNLSDTEYSTMGYDDNIEYDLSGYKSNGIKTSIIGWSGDTPRYNSSYKFDGTNYISMSSFLSTTSIYSKITISCWVKRTADFGDYNSFIYSGIIDIYVKYNYNNNPYTLMCNWNHTKEDFTYSSNTWHPNHHVPLNEWEHIAFTFDSGVITLFINGELSNSNDRSSTGIYIYGRRGSSIGVRCDSIQLSDLRVYATALSEEDIKELYSVSASIDNVGNLYSAEVFEG